MVKTKTHTKAKVLTAITVAAAGVAAYAIGSLPLNQVDRTPSQFAQCQDICAAQQNSCTSRVIPLSADESACTNAFTQCANLCVTRYPVRSATGVVNIDQNVLVVRPSSSFIKLPEARQNQGYDQLLTLNGQSGPLHWKLVSGALPPGMNIDEGGHLYGSPTRSDGYDFTLSIHSPVAGVMADMAQTFRIYVAPALQTETPAAAAPLRIVTSGAPGGLVGIPYHFQFAATGGSTTGVNKWKQVFGTKPPGLDITEDGQLTGTPTERGSFRFIILVDRVASAADPIVETRGVRQEIQVVIQGDVSQATPLQIQTSSLPAATVGTVYAFQLTAQGGVGEYQWQSLDSGSSPEGFSVSPTGLLTGTPTQAGTRQVKVKVVAKNISTGEFTSIEKTLPLVINEAPSTLIAADYTLPSGRVGQAYQESLRASGGQGAYVWTMVSGAPTGFTLSRTGVLTGTPTRDGVYTMTVKVGDDRTAKMMQIVLNILEAQAVTPEKTVEPIAVIPVAQDPKDKPVENTQPVNGGTVQDPKKDEVIQPPQTTTNTQDKDNVAVTTQPVDNKIVDPVTTDPKTTDTKTVATVQAVGYTNVGAYPDGFVGYYYNARPFEVTGGTGTYTWRIVSGSLPDGLTMGNRGEIAGNPTRVQTRSFVMEVRDQNGDTVRANRVIEIRAAAEYTTVVNNTQPTDTQLTARLAKLRQIGVSVHDLIKLQDDGDADTQYDTTVYYIGADGRRHAFPNNKVYFTWFADYSHVRVIAPHDLSDIQLGANITYRPGVRLVKFISNGRVYAVDTQRRLRWIRTSDVAERMFGSSWMYGVDDISDAFYLDYQFGNDVAATSDFNSASVANGAVYPSQVLPE